MANVVDKLNEFYDSFSCNESLAAQLREKIKIDNKDSAPPKDYYYLTELCNPAHSYWTRKFSPVQKPRELQLKLNWGNRLHNLAGLWFKSLPNLETIEGTLDGSEMGLNVVGRIDFRINGSVVELKTKEKEKIPKNPEEIFTNYPQDLEQVAFYSVLDPTHPKENYLVFMEDSPPYKIKAFKIETKDIGGIKNLLAKRIKILDAALSENKPSSLGKCRHCPFEADDGTVYSCPYHNLDPLSVTELKKSLVLKEDFIFSKTLESCKTNSLHYQGIYFPFDILAPRKYFDKFISGTDNAEDYDFTKIIKKSFFSKLIRELNLSPDQTDRKTLCESILEPRLYPTKNWIRIKNVRNKDGELIPFIVKVSNSSIASNVITKPNNYHIAELSILTAANGKDKGLIFIADPKVKEFVQVFQVNYKNGALKEIKSVIDLLELAKTKGDNSFLPENPLWMN